MRLQSTPTWPRTPLQYAVVCSIPPAAVSCNPIAECHPRRAPRVRAAEITNSSLPFDGRGSDSGLIECRQYTAADDMSTPTHRRLPIHCPRSNFWLFSDLLTAFVFFYHSVCLSVQWRYCVKKWTNLHSFWHCAGVIVLFLLAPPMLQNPRGDPQRGRLIQGVRKFGKYRRLSRKRYEIGL